MERSGRRAATERVFLVLLVSVAALAAISTLTWPIGYDTGVFSWIGGVWGRGGVPYRDAWDPKGPATYLPFALLEATSGQTLPAIRLMDLLFLGGGCFAVFRILQRLGSSRAGLLAAASLALSHVGLGYAQTVQVDAWGGWLAAGAIALTIGPKRVPAKRFAWAGALVGLAAMIKPHFLLLLAVPALAAGARGPELLALGLGAVVAPIGIAAWFALRGSFGVFTEAYVAFNLQNPHTPSSLLGFFTTVRRLIPASPAVIPVICAAGAGLGALARSQRRVALQLALWLLLGLSSVAVQSSFHPYYWQLLPPALAVAAATGVTFLWSGSVEGESDALRAGRRTVAAALVAMALSWLVPPGVHALADWAGSLRGGRALMTDYSAFSEEQGGQRAGAPEQAESTSVFLRRSVPAGSRVLIWSDPWINQLAGTPSPGRFTTYAPLTTGGGVTPLRRRYRAEFLADFVRNPPVLVLMDTVALTPEGTDILNLGRFFPEFLIALDAGYQATGSVSRFVVYHPRTPPGTLPPPPFPAR